MLSSLNKGDKAEMQDFRTQMVGSIKNGEFDAATMAEDAPESVKAFAKENGIDLTAKLEQISEKMVHIGQMKGNMQHQDMNTIPGYPQESASISSLLETLLKEESNVTSV